MWIVALILHIPPWSPAPGDFEESEEEGMVLLGSKKMLLLSWWQRKKLRQHKASRTLGTEYSRNLLLLSGVGDGGRG